MARMCGRSGDGRLEDKRDRREGDHNAFEEAYGDEEATGHDPAKRDKKNTSIREKWHGARGKRNNIVGDG